MTRIFVRPAPDKSADAQPAARLKVRKPVGGHLADAGEWQNLDSYWQRRINDGDVEVIEGLTEEAPAAPGAADTGSSVRAGSSKK
jgi:hypothetical protein